MNEYYVLFEQVRLFFILAGISTALVSIVYIPTLGRASNTKKVRASILIFLVSAPIVYAYWDYNPASYNSGFFGLFGPALFSMFLLGWFGCTIIDILRIWLKPK